MALDPATVAKIATLARLALNEEETQRLAGELSQIIGWVEQLAEVDTDGVAPMTSAVETSLPLRPDQVADGGIRDKVLANAPESTAGFFVVPKTVE